MYKRQYRGRPRARDAEGPRPQSALALLRSNPSFTLMLAGVLLSLTAVLPLSNFLVNIVTSRGGTDADLGLAMFVMGAFELPTAFLFPRLLRRFGSGRLLVLSAVFGTCLLYTSFLVSAAFLIKGTYNPFIYFNF